MRKLDLNRTNIKPPNIVYILFLLIVDKKASYREQDFFALAFLVISSTINTSFTIIRDI